MADECCDAELVASLRGDGHDVKYVVEKIAGASDDEILGVAYDEGRILLTEDKDFGELVYRLKKPSRGIILLRIGVQQRQLKQARVKKLVKEYEDRLPGNLVVVDVEKFRFRPLIFRVT
ncbi:MAG: DUF5615 family PIN-like protein [Deltaproteobacteria bacterium]